MTDPTTRIVVLGGDVALDCLPDETVLAALFSTNAPDGTEDFRFEAPGDRREAREAIARLHFRFRTEGGATFVNEGIVASGESLRLLASTYLGMGYRPFLVVVAKVPDDGFELQEDGRLQMSLLGATTPAVLKTTARVDRDFALQTFDFSLDPGTGPMTIRAIAPLIDVQPQNDRGARSTASPKRAPLSASLTTVHGTTSFWKSAPDHSTKATAIRPCGPA